MHVGETFENVLITYESQLSIMYNSFQYIFAVFVPAYVFSFSQFSNVHSHNVGCNKYMIYNQLCYMCHT